MKYFWWKNPPFLVLLWTCQVVVSVASENFEAPEPFEYLKNVCLDCGPPAPLSPDPLVQAQWSDSTNLTQLQIYRVTRPLAIAVDPPSAAVIEGWQEWLISGSGNLIVHEACNVTIDWGVERAGWLEFLANTSSIRAGISEFNTPYPGKTKAPVKYGDQTYRLEPNPELYEGVRYTFLYFQEPTRISNISLVAKIKPIAYSGAYSSSEETLTRTWYTGAYGVRLNMEATQFNSILIDRGDRVAIQGDGHPSMATALVGFGSPYLWQFVQTELWKTNSGHVHGHNVVDQSILAYPLYWCLSVLDWYWASGNRTGFQELVPDVRSILDVRVETFLDWTQDIGWMGWDDRLGNGWCFHSNNDTCPLEGHYTLAGLVARVCKDLARSLQAVGDEELAQQYHQTHQKLIQQFQAHVPPDRVGVHAAANMINADMVSDPQEIIPTKLNNVATLCSWSPFNQYWILQALAHDIERGLASVDLCWGPMLKINKGCFWELSGPDWSGFLKQGDMPPTMPSLCHPWASGVTTWLSKVHGGIQPLLPGYEQVMVAPYVSVNYPNVTTTMPTAHGSVSVNATLDGDHILFLQVDSPVGGYVGLRRTLLGACALDQQGIFLHQKLVPELFTRHDLTHLDVPAHARNFLFIQLPSDGGRHNLIVPYGCRPKNNLPMEKASPFPPAHFPASFSFDRESRGSGLTKYGPDGYLLLGYNEDKSDMENLPDYVESLKMRNHGFDGWKELPRQHLGSSANDPTFIPNPLNSSTPRALGAISFGEPGYWDPGVLVDVKVNEQARNALESVLVDIQTNQQQEKVQTFQFSLYCVGDGKNAVRIMDLETLDPIAPTVLVDQYQEGLWYTVSYTRSIRLRVQSMYGIQISAVAFASPSMDSYLAQHPPAEVAVGAKTSPFPPAHYPASVEFDRTSRGDGLKAHGADGYLLLGYNEDQSDMKKLPDYVESLKVQNHGYGGWNEVQERTYLGSSTSNSTFLPNPLNSSAPRALGVIDNDEHGSQGFLINVKLKGQAGESLVMDKQQQDQAYKLSIYCVGHGKHAVRIMDFETLDPIAPTVLVDQYGAGAWYTVTYTKSIRLRVMVIDAIQMSAIAFNSPGTDTIADQ